MTSSNLSTLTPIAERTPATPALWNSAYTQIDANFQALQPTEDAARYGLHPSLANNYSAAAAAIAGMSSAGLTLRLGAGTYLFDWLTPTTVTAPLIIEGVGPQTVLKFKNAGTVGIFSGVANASTIGVTFRRLTIDGNRTNQSGYLDLIAYTTGPMIFEDVAFTSFKARAIYGNTIPYFRLRRFTVADANETTDAQLAGGCGLAYLPTLTGPIDVGEGRFVQTSITNTLAVPFGVSFQGTAAQLLSGTIEDLYFEKYGHKGVDNPLGCVDVYNWGNDLVIRGITGRDIAHTLIKTANGARMRLDATIISSYGTYSWPGVQYGTGTHQVTGDFPDPTIQVKASWLTNGPVVNVTGGAGSEIKNPRVTVDARNCYQAIYAGYLDGGSFDVVAENSTASVTADTSVIYIGAGCKNQITVRASISTSAMYPIYSVATLADITVLPGSRVADSPSGLQHIRVDGVRNFDGRGIVFSGTATSPAVWINGATEWGRITDCRGPAGTTALVTATSGVVNRGHTWQSGSTICDWPSLNDATSQSTVIGITGARAGDAVEVEFSASKQGTFMWGDVTASDVVTVYHRNETGGAVNLSSGTLTARVRRG